MGVRASNALLLWSLFQTSRDRPDQHSFCRISFDPGFRALHLFCCKHIFRTTFSLLRRPVLFCILSIFLFYIQPCSRNCRHIILSLLPATLFQEPQDTLSLFILNKHLSSLFNKDKLWNMQSDRFSYFCSADRFLVQ